MHKLITYFQHVSHGKTVLLLFIITNLIFATMLMYTQATWKCRFRAKLGHQSKAQHAYNGCSLVKCCNAALVF